MIDDFLSGGDIHTRTASAVFGTPIELVSPELRKKAKAVNFGILYGMGAFSLAKDLDIPLRRAKNYIEGYLANYAEVDKYLKNVIQSAKEDGYTRTLFGRRRYIPELREKNKVRVAFGERVAMNSPIQGTAADIIKLAMIHVDARLREAGLDAHLILQVHDELILDSAASCAKKAAEILREEMEHVVRYRVPLTVELSMGKNWLDSES